MTFSDLQLIQPLLTALNQKGYTRPTPIQQQAIPTILAGKDVFGNAQTGTGKTAAFSLPILQQLVKNNHGHKHNRPVRALILAPTRELAIQISEQFTEYGKNLRIYHTTIYGGVSQKPQVNTLRRGVDVIIATPGRLLDLMNQGFVELSSVEHFVLDEADRMLDMGFIRDIRKIITRLPRQKQTLFFSATAPKPIMDLARDLLHQPVSVSVNPVSSASELVNQRLYYVRPENKRSLLKHILQNEEVDQALVFTRTKHGANRVARELNNAGIRAEAIHGNKSQGARTRALEGFKQKSINVLVATDIASRGIDVDQLSHVINYELPNIAETYVHRIGRTGRAGKSGTALSFCAHDEKPYLKDINKLLKRDMEIVHAHPFV